MSETNGADPNEGSTYIGYTSNESTHSKNEVYDETLLEEVDRTVNEARITDYGSPQENFENIARLWTSYINNILKDNFDYSAPFQINSKDVAFMMTLLKMGREQNKHKRDNLVDAAGYILCAAQIEGID